MASKKFSPIPKSDREEVFDALFGPPEEMDEESADAYLEAHDIDPARLVSELKERVSREARKLRVAGKEHPTPMRNAQQGLRESERRKSEPPRVDPDTWIHSLLNGDFGSAGQAEVVYSFHNRRGDLSENDQSVLKSLDAELADETKGETNSDG